MKNKIKYKLNYTELINNKERLGEDIIETDDISWTIEQFSRNRSIIKMDITKLKPTL
jgi:hypothetical protein|tara:strand:- start:1381 stop:1551 length:171 start_codon:yes stop_codon:yes gene_type:complete